MAIETDVSELREQRRKKTRRTLLIRLCIVLAAAIVVLVIVMTRNKWYPYLNGILSKVPNIRSGQTAVDDDIPENGRFPITSEGGSEFQFAEMDGGFALIDDSRFYVYNTDGKRITEKQHIFTNPILDTSGKKALIYDLGGNAFSLESKYKTIYDKTTESPILLARLSENDIAAVVTKSDKFLAQLDIYSAEGTCIFTYKSSDSRIIGVTFCQDGCLITTLGAKGGQIHSGLIRLGFSSGEPIWKSEQAATMAVSTECDSEGNIIICGNDRCDYFDLAGNLVAEHEYGDDLVDYDISSKMTAVLLENTALRKYGLMIIKGADCKRRIDVEVPEDARRVSVNGDLIYVLTGRGLFTYNSEGQQLSEVGLTDAYENFSKIDGYFFLKGYDRINRITYSG